MAFQITISGIDRTASIDLPTVRVNNTLLLKSDTMSFEATTDGSWRPQAGNEVVFTNAGVREFAGVIVSTEEELENPDILRYAVTCKDYTQFFDHHLVQATYPSQAADLTVKDIVTNFANRSGVTFTTANVDPSFILPAQTFPYMPPSEAIKQLADLLEWLFFIDYNKDVHFRALESMASPLPGNLLLADSDVSSYHDLRLSEDISQLKNRIFLRGFSTRSTTQKTFQFTGDGVTTWFPLGYAPWSTDSGDIAVTVAGVPQTILKDNVDGQAGDGKVNPGAYVCFDNMGIRFNQPPAAGAVVSGSLKFAFPAVTAMDDPESQGKMAAREGTDGVYEYAVEDPNLSAPTMDTANSKGQLLLYKYGYPKLTGVFGSFLQGWRAGQSFTLRSLKRMGGLDQKMYVTKVAKTIIQADPVVGGNNRLHYDVSIADSPFVI